MKIKLTQQEKKNLSDALASVIDQRLQFTHVITLKDVSDYPDSDEASLPRNATGKSNACDKTFE